MAFNPKITKLALRSRLLATTGIPTSYAWTSVAFKPTTGVPYLDEDFAPSVGFLRTVNAANGILEARGIYAVKWYGPSNVDTNAIEDGLAAIAAKFTPGTSLTLSSGDVVVMRGDVAAIPEGVYPAGAGWAVGVLKVFWELVTRNVIAA